MAATMIYLYGVHLSPFVRKVTITLQLKELEYEHDPVMPSFGGPRPEGQPDDWETISPMGLVPALRDGTFTVSDSSVICEYLDERYPKKSLTPKDPVARARCHWYEEYGDVAVVDAVMPVFRERIVRKFMHNAEPNEQLIQESIDELQPRVFDYLDRALDGTEYLVDNSVSAADISVFSPILNMHYAGHSIDADRWKNLAAFYKRMTEIPVIAKILAAEQSMLGGNN